MQMLLSKVFLTAENITDMLNIDNAIIIRMVALVSSSKAVPE
jgi:hypothetical protein